jgi:metal-responsive CopG/Arc/MetJ family transcriptional regulator
MNKIKLDANLYARVERAAKEAGYSSVDEFVAHAIENELKRSQVDQAEQQVADQLRGLGYIE